MYTKDDKGQPVLTDRREMLRVKVKSLAEEARIIRREEARTRWALREELRLHRIGTVRSEARLSHLAYGLIRGLSYADMEQEGELPTEQGAQRILAMIQKYGAKTDPHAKLKPTELLEVFKRSRFANAEKLAVTKAEQAKLLAERRVASAQRASSYAAKGAPITLTA